MAAKLTCFVKSARVLTSQCTMEEIAQITTYSNWGLGTGDDALMGPIPVPVRQQAVHFKIKPRSPMLRSRTRNALRTWMSTEKSFPVHNYSVYLSLHPGICKMKKNRLELKKVE
ncbi:hypothetical protein DITRI_Ditri14bG0071800 [Diplodiscus trichospermus]